jgi:hypothetical protein
MLPTLVLAAFVAILAITLPQPLSPRGPGGLASSTALEFLAPTPSYEGSRLWYNFSVTVNQPNLTWAMLRFSVTPGPLTRSISNWTLRAIDPGSDLVASFQLAAGNWTSDSTRGVVTGDSLLLEADSSLTLGDFNAAWPGLGPGSYSVELLS